MQWDASCVLVKFDLINAILFRWYAPQLFKNIYKKFTLVWMYNGFYQEVRRHLGSPLRRQRPYGYLRGSLPRRPGAPGRGPV